MNQEAFHGKHDTSISNQSRTLRIDRPRVDEVESKPSDFGVAGANSPIFTESDAYVYNLDDPGFLPR